MEAMASLSARRAWIEMFSAAGAATGATVALRKESVDRNHAPVYEETPVTVALRKESVDRNCRMPRARPAGMCRSPQGERG